MAFKSSHNPNRLFLPAFFLWAGGRPVTTGKTTDFRAMSKMLENRVTTDTMENMKC